MIDRFSRENILKHVRIHKDNKFTYFIKNSVIGLLIDWGFFFALTSWMLASFIIEFDLNIKIIVLIFLGILALYFSYLFFVSFNNPKVNKYSIKINNLHKPVSFVFLSDIHIGNERFGTNKQRLKKFISMINELNPELVIFGGDFVTNNYELDLLKELQNIKAKHKIGVYGNHDSAYLKDRQQTEECTEGIKKLESQGIDILVNESKEVELGGEKISFGGIPDMYSANFNLDTTFKNAVKDYPKILLSHNPDIIDFVEEKDQIDLILSGHNHSGQIKLPVIGPVLPMPSKYRWLTKGLFKINKNTQLFLSQGAGASGTRIRIGTECEICLIVLEPKEQGKDFV